MARLLLLATLVLVISVVIAANDQDQVDVQKIADLKIPSPGSASSTSADGAAKSGTSQTAVVARGSIKYAYSCWTNSIPQGSNSLFTVSVRPNKLSSCFTACAIYKKNGCKGFVWSQKYSACVLKKKVSKIYYPFYGYVTCSIRWL
ncbi:hypothetical protein CBR_g17702 [Chara braunii]|uniref:Apple domain-containing protein n=1 Tax=Chara braunii TaxID=69332 RepID=A0A388KVI9_CHABU|nr:hypothetical protein CBR_g17702 [Chara braunii]|eukprot:GBG73992.1 hypothetical protein CBR_g17702 [Chara braunii]